MTRGRQPVFYGWWVALTAALGLFFGVAPIFVFSFSVFLKAFAVEFHATRAAVSLAFTLHNLLSAFTVPFAGRLIDRFGSRRVILPSTVIFGLILLLALLTRSLWEIYLFLQGCRILRMWFGAGRLWKHSCTMVRQTSGTGSSGDDAWNRNWCDGHAVPSAAFNSQLRMALCVRFVRLRCPRNRLPVVRAFLRDNPEQIGLLPDGAALAPVTDDRATSGLSWPEARRNRSFWFMVGAFFLLGASVHACVLHMVPMLTDRGITAQTAALASSSTGAALLIGRICAGGLMDRYFAPFIAVSFSIGVALGILVLAFGHSTPLAFVGAFLVGLGMGAEADIIAYLTSRYCGLRSFGEIYGYAFATFVIAGAVGTLLMGVGFDRTGGYVVPLTGFFGATSVAAILFGLLGPYKYARRSS